MSSGTCGRSRSGREMSDASGQAVTGLFLYFLKQSEALHADFPFRSFYVSKAAALCRAQHFDDDHHLYLQHCRRLFRLELRRQKFVCRAEPHLSRHHGARRRRLYDRHRRQRAHRQNARRGQAQESERDLLHARHRACRRRRDFKRRVHRFPAPHLVRRRRDGPDDRRLRALWARAARVAPLFHAAKQLPELFGDGGKAALRPARDGVRGADEHGTRFSARLRVPVRASRCGARHGVFADCRRAHPACLLSPPERFAAAPHASAL